MEENERGDPLHVKPGRELLLYLLESLEIVGDGGPRHGLVVAIEAVLIAIRRHEDDLKAVLPGVSQLLVHFAELLGEGGTGRAPVG